MNKFGRNAKEVDICLILEGSYPFILGGVSSWVHKIIRAFPQYTFGVVFLGSSPEDYLAGPKYELPPNVTYFDVFYLFVRSQERPTEKSMGSSSVNQMKCMHAVFREEKDRYLDLLNHMDFFLDSKNRIKKEEFFFSKESWDYITEQYLKYSSEPSFIDYFWTVKNIHEPLWVLPDIVDQLPQAKVIHSLSTGYAGFLGALLYKKRGYPVILSEHGIYTKERRIEIMSSNVFRDLNFMQNDIVDMSYLRILWNNFFEALAKLCYSVADPIVSLFSGAHQIQLEYGVNVKNTKIIPNGIDVEYYANLYRPNSDKLKPIVGFIGRIVPIKDVKSIIRSAAIVRKFIPEVEFWLIGPIDEDVQYVLECENLIESLELQSHVKIMSSMNLEEVYPKLKLVVLSSISEGMPLVILESNAAGIPVVATDVGACRELIEGQVGDDALTGHSGKIVKIADPDDLSQAVIHYLKDMDAWNQASEAGRMRVKRYYDQDAMFSQYEEIYQKRFK